ncbi:MAG: cytochrome c oxidase subunit II, partial [Planctomycetaceae bacterium]|nr:cytochrome c oxidase subunit II [Planctomycetaceae bacterium]
MKWFWCLFFALAPILAMAVSIASPGYGWWFPSEAASPLGQRIDDLFYMILMITTVTFIGTQIGLVYVLFKGARRTDADVNEKAWFS